MAFKKISIVFLLFIFGLYFETAKSQYCGCSPIFCCSIFGYCGITDDYCGSACKSGPCRKSRRESIDMIVTHKFFDGIISQANSSCSGKRFYTRDSFLEAANTYLDFTMSVTRLEIATMFAHFTQATEHFCYIEEVSGSSYYHCSRNNSEYPCEQGKNYYGRGPIQLSWNYNYGACGRDLGLDLLRQPELVSSNPTVAFRTGLWFWMKSVRPVLNQGFEATIRAIKGGNPSMVARLTKTVEYYTNYCKQLGVDPDLNGGTIFMLKNNCPDTVWVGTLASQGPKLGDGGFELAKGASRLLRAPAGWSGRFWARTGCNFDASGNGRCVTGDCGGRLRCNNDGVPPVTLAEFTFVGDDGRDFYDVSLVNGYNVKVGITPSRGSVDCKHAGCVADLNVACPNELHVISPQGKVVACKSACEAFNTDQYCCRGSYSIPQNCPPTNYSRMFKKSCPDAYSYAYDDETSIFTCTGANYEITFCP